MATKSFLVVQLTLTCIVFVASWHQVKGVSNNRHEYEGFRITTILNKPFMMLKAGDESSQGNDRFEGYIPDLLKELQRRKNYKYVIQLVADSKYGAMDANGTWNGLVGELLANKADIVAADLTITAARQQAIEFTVPYKHSGIATLAKKAPLPAMDMSVFLKPFALDVWLLLVVAFFAFTIIFFILGRFSSAEWIQSEVFAERQNNLNVGNALYFVIASITFQNAMVAPRGFATRLLSVIWWFFSLFVFCCYLANLVSIVIYRFELQMQAEAINTLEDLVHNPEMQYGTLRSGSTYTFFKNSQLPLHQFMYDQMQEMEPSPFVSSYSEGIEKVRKGNYALFMEYTSIAYLISRDCSLTQVGDLLDYKGYGFALKKGDPYVKTLSLDILRLQEEGFLHLLHERWWGKSGSGGCSADGEVDKRGSLNLHNLSGVFIFLVVGAIIAICFAVAELFWRAKDYRSADGGSICNEVMREATFALCGGPNPRSGDKRNGRQGDDISLERQNAV